MSEETFWVDVYKAVVDFVEHPQADLLSSVFKIWYLFGTMTVVA